jgi:hypothetical protein
MANEINLSQVVDVAAAATAAALNDAVQSELLNGKDLVLCVDDVIWSHDGSAAVSE